jgi:hypothetical protein
MYQIKQYGNRSEVLELGKVVFIGSEKECDAWVDSHEIICVIDGIPIPKEALKTAFNIVANPVNWKLPIDKDDVSEESFCQKIISKAIEFFTGSTATWTELPDKSWNVKAPGYYIATGA